MVKDKDNNVNPSGLVDDDDTMSTPASDAPTASVIIAVTCSDWLLLILVSRVGILEYF